MSSAVRRKVLISSDEESDAENQTYLDEVEEPSVVPPSDESAQEDSLASKSSDHLNQTDEEIISGSESFLSTRDTSTNSSIVASTPKLKIKPRSSTYDLENSMNQLSIARKNQKEDGDRSRSFRGDNENDDFTSPISRKLAEKDDLVSKQKLRERVLKKNALKERNSGVRTADPLLETTLSPVLTNRRSLGSSHMSVDSEESILVKSSLKPLEDSDIVEESFQEGAVLMVEGRNSSPEEENPVYISYREPEFIEDSIQIIEDFQLENKNESSGIIEISTGDGKIGDEESYDEQEPEGMTCVTENRSQDEGDVVEDSMQDFIADDDEEEENEEGDDEEDCEVTGSASILDKTPPRRNRAQMPPASAKRKVYISSDEEEESEAEVDSEDEEEEENSSKERANDPSIVCLSSDEDEEEEAVKKTDQNDQKKGLEVPKHLQEFMKEDLRALEKKKQTMEGLLQKSLNLSDGGVKLHEAMRNLREAIQWKKKIGDVRPPSAESKPIVPIISPKPFDPSVYKRLLANDKKRLFGGKMTEGRFQAINRTTEKCLKGMHEAIATMPDESQILETPRGLRLELMHHQKQGLAWMVWRETQNAPGGILADDMGLGKTLSTISLVLHQKNERLKRKEEGNDKEDRQKAEIAERMGLVPSNTTLVVAPASVIYQWESEIEKRVKTDRLAVHVFHGPKNKRIDNPKRLARYDIVITTYNLVGTELMEKITTKNNEDDESSDSYDEDGKKTKKMAKRVLNTDSVLAKVAFERIILDEAHQIKNKNTSASKGACSLAGRNRWCLSGTPIHNNLWDLYSLIRFLRVAPFEDETHWKEYIMKSSQKSADRLNILTKSLLLRRTKAQTCAVTQKPLVDLQPKVVKQHDIVLEGIEGDIYDMMFRATQQHVKALMDEEDNERYENLYGRRRKKGADTIAVKKSSGDGRSKFSALTSMLVMLLRLRQACVHLHLTQKAVDMEAFEHLGGDSPLSVEDILEKTMAEMTLGEKVADSSDAIPRSITAEEVFEPTYLSSKVKKVMEIVTEVMDLGDKIVIVSQWTSLLNLIEVHLKEKRAKFTTISGQIAPSDRQERVDSFNKENGGARVLLLSLTAGGVGLNLVGGNHLIMVDLHWNPALEAQACDRIYRMGQKKTVHIHRLIAQGTIEQRVVNLQEQKLKLANDVLDGAASKKMNKLTMQDLKYLFKLDDEEKPKKTGKSAMNQTTSGGNGND